MILPAAQKPLSLTSSGASDAGSVSGGSANAPSPAPSNSSNNPSEQPPLRPLGKLEDMKGTIRNYQKINLFLLTIVKVKTAMFFSFRRFFSERSES